MSEKIERNPQVDRSLGSGGSSLSFRDTPSSNTLSSSPGSETWDEKPGAHLNNSPSSSNPQSQSGSSHTSVKPKLLTSNLRPNDKPGDSDRRETSREEGDVSEFYRDQNLDLKVDGKIEDTVLQNRGYRPPQTTQAFQFQSPTAK